MADFETPQAAAIPTYEPNNLRASDLVMDTVKHSELSWSSRTYGRLSTINLMSTMAERIKEARESTGLNLPAFGKKLGVSKAAVWGWEHGGIKTLKGENLYNLCDLTGYNVRYITHGTGPKKKADRQQDLTDLQQTVCDLFDGLTTLQQQDLLHELREKVHHNEIILDDLTAKRKKKNGES